MLRRLYQTPPALYLIILDQSKYIKNIQQTPNHFSNQINPAINFQKGLRIYLNQLRSWSRQTPLFTLLDYVSEKFKYISRSIKNTNQLRTTKWDSDSS